MKNKAYKFALIGISATGKTCLLARLWNYTGENSLTSNVNRPVSLQKQNDPDETSTEKAESNLDLLEQAHEELEKNELPGPTDLNAAGAISFTMGSQHRGQIKVDTFDYSGEFVNEKAATDVQSSSKWLASVLAGHDGLLIVIGPPRKDKQEEPNATSDSTSSDDNPRGFLNAILNNDEAREALEKYPRPIGVVIAKWDRMHQVLKNESTKISMEEIRQFKTNYDDKRSAAITFVSTLLGGHDYEPKIDASLQGAVLDKCMVFPASAFGAFEHRQNADGNTRLIEAGEDEGLPIEFPDPNGQPYGIVDPFIALADECDRRDVANLLESHEEIRTPPWKWIKYSNPAGHWKCLRSAKKLLSRIPPKMESHKDVTRIWRAAVRGLGVIMIAVFFLGDLTWGTYRMIQIQGHIGITDRSAPLEQHKNAEDALRKASRGWNGLLVELRPKFDETKLIGHADDINEKYIEISVGQIKGMADPDEQYKAAKNFRRDHGHSKCIEAIISERELEIRRRLVAENENQLTDLKSKWTEVSNETRADDVQSVGRFLDALDKHVWTHPEKLTPKQKSSFDDLRAKVRKEQIQRSGNKNEREFKALVAKALGQKNYKDLELYIQTYTGPKTAIWEKALTDACDHIATMKKNSALQVKTSDYTAAKEAIDDYRNALAEISSAVTKQELKRKVETTKHKLTSEVEEHVDREWDRSMYDIIKTQKSSTGKKIRCDKYLKEAPRGDMRADVQKLLDWIKTHETKKQNVTFGVSIQWGKNFVRHPARVWQWRGSHFYVKSLVTPKKQIGNALSPERQKDPKKPKFYVGGMTVKNKSLSDRVTFQFRLMEDDYDIPLISADDEYGTTKKYTKTIKELMTGEHPLELKQEGKNYDNRIYVKYQKGIEKEPELPSWRSKK